MQPLATKPYELKDGQRLDLGIIKVVPARTTEAGTLGMSTEVVADVLTVATVRPGGPAEAAGVVAGDKISLVNGTPVASLTPAVAQTLLSSGTVGVGDSFQLTLDRAGTPVQIALVAVKW
jgi:S1-C subfamily serine protease